MPEMRIIEKLPMREKTIMTSAGSFERIAVALLSLTTGGLLAFLAIKGPLVLGQITYKTHTIINNQLMGQDLVNLLLLSPISIIGGITLLLRKPIAKYLLISTPLYLIYYVLSYTIAWEWSSPNYMGNSEDYTFHFLFILISALIVMLYSLSLFVQPVRGRFSRKGLTAYSVIFTLFLLLFASMWAREIIEVIETGTARAYDIAPGAFWLVRIFDLGFSIPLGLISVYLLWTHRDSTFPIQMMFYGFFITMLMAVNAMGIMMLVHDDPTFLWRDLAVFMTLAGIVAGGFVYILSGYRNI